MSSQKEKLPLKSSIEPGDIGHYHFHGGVDKRSRLRTLAEHDALYPDTLEWVEAVNGGMARHEVEVSPETLEMFEDAKRFVEDKTGYDLSDVRLAGTSNRLSDFTAMAAVLEQKVWSRADTNTYPYNTYPPSLRRQLFTGLFVHELMHSIGVGTRRLTAIRREDGLINVVATSGLRTMDMRAPTLETLNEIEGADDTSVGHFFEEAAAEEMASLYRESINADVQLHSQEKCTLLNHPNLPALPYKYLDSDRGFHKDMPSYLFATAAFAAAGLREIGEYTGVDIFQLMVDSRDPIKEAEARRGIIQAVESVQKGLYPKLRDLPYLLSSFVNGHEMILRAIEDDKRRKLGAATLAA